MFSAGGLSASGFRWIFLLCNYHYNQSHSFVLQKKKDEVEMDTKSDPFVDLYCPVVMPMRLLATKRQK